MEKTMNELVVRKSIVVARPVEDAFRIFTEGIADWWPLATHSGFKDRSETVVLEGRLDGRFYERSTDGEESDWGRITRWDPPHRISYTWHPSREEGTHQDVDMRFTPEGEGTRVELIHTGWEKLGERAVEAVANYEKGWDRVLGRYAEAIS